MRTILIIAVLFIVQFNGNAQDWERYDSRIDSLQKLLNSSNDTIRANAIIEYAGVMIQKAWNATNQGEFAMAYETYDAALGLFENAETENFFKAFKESSGYEKVYWKSLANIYFNYGLLMSATQNREERLRYHRKTYEIAEVQNDTLHLVYSNGGMAMLYVQESNADSALAAAERALSYDPKSYGYASYSMLLYFKGASNLLAGNNQLAKSSFERGLDYSLLDKMDIHHAINCLGLSEAYAELNERDSSYYYAVRALNMLKEIKEIQMLKIDLASGYENMYKHFLKFDQQDSAFKYLQLASDQRTFFSEKTIKNLAAFQQVLLQKQMRLKEIEKKQLENQAQNRLYWFVAAFLVFLVIGAILFYSNRQKQKANRLLAKQKDEVQTAMVQLKSAQAQLIQSEKMASLGELTAGIAHEIQNPLNFVNNFSDLSSELMDEMNEELDKGDIEEAKVISSDIKQNLEKITHHGKRADAIVKGMLAHSRVGKGEKVLTDINALAEEYLKLSYNGLLVKDKSFNSDIKTDFDQSLNKIDVIPQDIGKVLLNLFNNAFYAVNERSTRNLAGIEAFKPTVSLRTKKTEDKIEIRVSDNGNGIPQKNLDKIFQPFFTTKPTGQGTGLGLSLSYDIIKAHGGELKVETLVDGGNSDNIGKAEGLPSDTHGTTFIITLPITDLK